MGMGPNPNLIVQPSEYFLKALEAQRSINTHIHEIEPATPIFLFEIDLNEMKPATISYPSRNGPVKDGVIRIHNDFNLFNINRGVIKWRGNFYYPFPVYGEQFDITSNGTIPTPKVKFSSQFLDDEFNSFYKYIRMQINELKDIVGSKVTRRKTFIRYLSPDNFPGQINPFNTFTDTPWASRDGEVLTIRSLEGAPIDFSKWLVYFFKRSSLNNKIFASFRTDDRLKTLDIKLQAYNYSLESLDIFNLFVNEAITYSEDVIDSFSSDIFIFPASSTNYTFAINDPRKEYRKITDGSLIKPVCSSSSVTLSNSANSTITYPFTINAATANELATFVSFRPLSETSAAKFNYSISNQTTSSFTINYSKNINGSFEINYLTIPTGMYTGVNPYVNEDTNFFVAKISHNFGTATSGEYNITFPRNFDYTPKILFNTWGNAGFIYNQHIKNITATGCTFVAAHTGDNSQLQTQNIHLIVTDYMASDLLPTGIPQMYTAYHNLAREVITDSLSKNVETYEVELTPDIYYIDRKIQEDSSNVVYELASLLDIEGIKLPGRILLSKNCPFTYRGEGCVYERFDRLMPIHSGVYGDVVGVISPSTGTSAASTMPVSQDQKVFGLQSAPPVSDAADNLFTTYIGSNWIDKGYWRQDVSYVRSNYIYIEKNEIKYYFVCKTNHLSDSLNAPPNSEYWESDTCSKTLKACRQRWSQNPNFIPFEMQGIYQFQSFSNVTNSTVVVNDELIKSNISAPKDRNGKQLLGILPFGGFPSVEGKYQSQQGPQGP